MTLLLWNTQNVLHYPASYETSFIEVRIFRSRKNIFHVPSKVLSGFSLFKEGEAERQTDVLGVPRCRSLWRFIWNRCSQKHGGGMPFVEHQRPINF